ncbi:hypothetical protein F5Y14DRAFT_282892 [Nemania sp. NC0429]|nr:hypothetical protein F5Y14DRAFT_282892 [Nemania sp. NC0429]
MMSQTRQRLGQSAGNSTGQHTETGRHGYDDQGYEIIKLLKGFNAGVSSPYSGNGNHPGSRLSDARNVQSNNTSNISINPLERRTNSWSVLPSPRQNLFEGLPHLMSLSPYAQNATENHYGIYGEFEKHVESSPLVLQPNDDNILQSPIEAATRREILRILNGVSPNYRGDLGLATNRSANIPDELNTAVWITNLPPDLTYKMLLDSVRNCGKVYATVINGPGEQHVMSAGKIVFFDVAGAENLLRQAREGRFIVGDCVPAVRPNRIKSEAKPLSPHSRVLHIEGPSCIVNERYLADLFREEDIRWEDEEVLTLWSKEGRTRLEWRFGSYRSQAEAARLVIDRVKKRGYRRTPDEYPFWQNVVVYFGVDPCAPKPGKRFFLSTPTDCPKSPR